MDQLVLRSVWKSSAMGGNSLTLTGLLIEGATFNGNNLAASTATSENIDVVPDCNIVWINKVSIEMVFCALINNYPLHTFLETSFNG